MEHVYGVSGGCLCEAVAYKTNAPGSLDASTGLTLAKEIFIEDKPAFYEYANRTEKLYGSDALAGDAVSGGEPK